jgi:hypothetical protein
LKPIDVVTIDGFLKDVVPAGRLNLSFHWNLKSAFIIDSFEMNASERIHDVRCRSALPVVQSCAGMRPICPLESEAIRITTTTIPSAYGATVFMAHFLLSTPKQYT